MKKAIKWTLIIIAAIVLILFIAFRYLQHTTKQHSPEQLTQLAIDDTELEVFYNRPYKKDREIFGELVPYGEVWRTGANEATVFKTNVDLNIEGKKLPAGSYTLWTIPGEESWEVIFNSKQYSWGVNWDSEPSREPEYDALKVEVPVQHLNETVEQFTIELREGSPNYMHLMWDKTKISVPLEVE